MSVSLRRKKKVKDEEPFVPGLFKPLTAKQSEYMEAINTSLITFGVGAAGTGKSWIAVGCAIQALQQQLVKKIVLVRPLLECGEKVGFLPGDLDSKLFFYFKPLIDIFVEFLGRGEVNKMLENDTIEYSPLAFMRGTTFHQCFVILDEAQNSTKAQLKCFVTRLGRDTRMIIAGDHEQNDLQEITNPLADAAKQLRNIDERVSVVEFTDDDVVRHELVKKILKRWK